MGYPPLTMSVMAAELPFWAATCSTVLPAVSLIFSIGQPASIIFSKVGLSPVATA